MIFLSILIYDSWIDRAILDVIMISEEHLAQEYASLVGYLPCMSLELSWNVRSILPWNRGWRM